MATFDVRDTGETVHEIVFWSGVGNYASAITEFEGGAFLFMTEVVIILLCRTSNMH